MPESRFFLHQLARAEPKRLQLPEQVPLDKWCEIGSQLAALSEASAWWLGDWLVYGERRFPQRYRQALKDTGLEYQTLRNYAWVARRFGFARRRAVLSFQHHAEVAALSDAEQNEWLDRAEKFSWSRNQLRRSLKAHQLQARSENPDGARAVVVLELQVEPERQVNWRKAASHADVVFEEWAARALDQAARQGTLGRQPAGPSVA